MFETLPVKTVRRIEQRLQQLAELAAVVPMNDYRWRKLRDASSGHVALEIDGHRVLCAHVDGGDRFEVRRISSPPPKARLRLPWLRPAAPQPA